MHENNPLPTINSGREVRIGNTTYRVNSKYIGEKPFLDFIKGAIKREIEMEILSKSKV